MRRVLGRPVTYHELALQIRADIAADSRTEYLLDDASRKIREAVFDGQLRAFGLPGSWYNRTHLSNLPTQIPAEFFANSKNTLTHDGWATLDPDLSDPKEWRDPNTKSWVDVWFYSSEVEALIKANVEFPSRPVVEPVSARTGAPGRPTSAHFVVQEFNRRCQSGEVEDILSSEAKALSAWLKATHAGLPRMTPRTIENKIRDAHRRHRAPRN
jgi:hypothetical protein